VNSRDLAGAHPSSIRDARLPEDELAFAGFIDALQLHEHAFEPDRRIDAQAGRDYLAVLLKRVLEQKGRIFVAEMDGRAVGWAVFVEDSAPLYVIAEERRTGWISELFLDEAARGTGLGRALLAACEREASERGINVLMIGVHANNTRARKVYADAGFGPYILRLKKRL
jgi:GNAT superfamily N-acetyltransferase